MKARIYKRSVPTVLLYNIESMKDYRISEICGSEGISAVHLSTMNAPYSVGFLCGLEGFKGDIMDCEIPQEEAMIFSDVDRTVMNSVLDKLRAEKLTVDLKCVVTDTNKTWALGALITELEKEHKAMHGITQ